MTSPRELVQKAMHAALVAIEPRAIRCDHETLTRFAEAVIDSHMQTLEAALALYKTLKLEPDPAPPAASVHAPDVYHCNAMSQQLRRQGEAA